MQKLRTQEKRLACINLDAESSIALITKINVKIDELKLELEKESLHATQGAMLRSKSTYNELGEKNSKYFFALEKRNAKGKTMTLLINDKNESITGTQNILIEQANFYKKLYTKDPNISFKMDTLPERKVSETDKVLLDSDITMEELAIALQQTKNSKSPGLDGLSTDWYSFLCKIKHVLLDVFKECLSVKEFFHQVEGD